jgi:hypothetical protein
MAFYFGISVSFTTDFFRNLNDFVAYFTDVNSLDALVRLCLHHKHPDACLVTGLVFQFLSAVSETGHLLPLRRQKMELILDLNATEEQHELIDKEWKEAVKKHYAYGLLDHVVCVILFEVSADQTYISVKITAYIRLICSVMHLYLIHTGAV